jgi:hypothetical protein
MCYFVRVWNLVYHSKVLENRVLAGEDMCEGRPNVKKVRQGVREMAASQN